MHIGSNSVEVVFQRRHFEAGVAPREAATNIQQSHLEWQPGKNVSGNAKRMKVGIGTGNARPHIERQRRFGTRRILMIAFTVSAMASMAVTAFGHAAWVGAILILFAALCTSCIDGAGNMPFFRAVRPLEREEMTGVFSTYRDMGQLLPPAVFAVILRFAPVHAVFAVSGLWMLVMAWYCRYLPKRL